MRLLDHIYIIRSISNCKCDFALVVILYQVHNICFLLWWHTTGQNNIALISHLHKALLKCFRLVKCRQCWTSDDQCLLLLLAILSDFWLNVFNFLLDYTLIALNQLMLIHVVVEEASWLANIDCGSNLVASEYPHLDSSSFDELNDFSNFRLQSVLDGSWACNLHMPFDLFIDLFESLVPTLNKGTSLLCFCIPFIIGLLIQSSLREEQCPETFIGILINLFLCLQELRRSKRFLGQSFRDNWISTFAH